MLLRKFESLLDEHLTETGITGLVKAVFGILAAGGVLSTAFGSFTVKAAGLTIAALSTLAFLTLLVSSQRRLRRKYESIHALLDHHCDLWYEVNEHRWRIDHWDERAIVAPNGDAEVSITVRALVENTALPYFRIRIGSGRQWSQPEWERRRVKVNVRSEADGPRWDKTLRWLPDGRLEVKVHFRSTPPKKGDELRLLFVVDWPGKLRPLMRGEPDTFKFKAGRPLAYFSYRIRLPSGYDVRHELIGLRVGVDDVQFTKHPEVTLEARDIPAQREIGMRLDLK